MKQITLEKAIRIAENTVVESEWLRRNLYLKKYEGLSLTVLGEIQNEMENTKPFDLGIMKCGHSTTFINKHYFYWFMKWKEANLKKAKEESPEQVLKRLNLEVTI